MFAWIVVVELDLHDLVSVQEESIGVGAVDLRVVDQIAGAERAKDGGDFGTDVGLVVDESVVGSIAEIVHFYGQ